MPRNRITYLLIVLLVCSVWSGQCGERNGRTERASQLYLEGVKQQSFGRIPQAFRLYEATIRLVPEHAAAYHRLSGLAQILGKPQQALFFARCAYELDSACRDYADTYARMLAMTGHYGAADTLFTTLAERDPGDWETLSLRAILKAELEQYDEALALVDTLEARVGIRAMTVDVKRQALIRTERYTDTFDYMAEVCAQYPGDVSFRLRWAELAAALQREEIALLNYAIAIDLDSTGLAPRMALAEYYRLKEQWPEFLQALVPVFAHADFPTQDKVDYFETHVRTPEVYRRYFVYVAQLTEALLRADPENPTAQEFYVKHLMSSGQFDRVQQYLADRIGEGSAPLKFYCDAIEIAQYREQQDTMERYVALARERFPREPELAMTLLGVRFRAKDTTAVVETAQEIVRYSTNDSITGTAYGILGDMAHLRGDNRAAFRFYEQALKRQPDSPSVLNNFAYYLSEEQRELERALRMAERANELDPQNPTYLDTQAWVLYRLGRYDEAQAVMRQALVLDRSNSSELLLHYGDILFALGKRFMAKTYWQRALEAGADGAKIEERIGWLGE